MLSELLTSIAELLSWRVVSALYLIVGVGLVCYLDIRGRARNIPRHERWNPTHRVVGSDVLHFAASLYPVLLFVLILFWPLWALYIWFSHCSDDDANI